MIKKKILFVIESLGAAGAEKSLVTFLSVLDKEKYEIDLQLFSYGGEFEKYLSNEVNLLPPLGYTAFTNQNILCQFFSFKYNYLLARLRYSFSIRKKGLRNKDRARLFWKYVSDSIPQSKKKYDIYDILQRELIMIIINIIIPKQIILLQYLSLPMKNLQKYIHVIKIK